MKASMCAGHLLDVITKTKFMTLPSVALIATAQETQNQSLIMEITALIATAAAMEKLTAAKNARTEQQAKA